MAVWATAGRLGIRGCDAGVADKAEAAVVVVWPAGQGLAMLSVDRLWAGISHPPPHPTRVENEYFSLLFHSSE